MGRAAPAWLLRAAVLAAVYVVVAKLGLRYASIGQSISPVWPPTGVALAGLVILGPRYWPTIFLGAFVANVTTPIPLGAALGIACGNTAEAALGAYLLRGHAPGAAAFVLDNLDSVRRLVVVAAPLAAVASATTGVTSLVASHALSGQPFGPALLTWWAGDYVGALVVTPVLLAWQHRASAPLDGREALEILIVMGATLVAAGFVLGGLVPPAFLRPSDYPYLLFPFVIAAALRFGPRGASATTLAVAGVAVGYAVRGGGPFVMQTVPSTDASLLLYIAILAVTGLTLGAVAVQHQRAQSALQDANENLRAAVHASPLAIYAVDRDAIVRAWNPAAETLYGWRADEVIGRSLPIVASDATDYGRLRERVLRGEVIRGAEITRRKKDGSPLTVSLSIGPLHDTAGRVTGMLSVAADLTEVRQLEVQYRQAQKMEVVGRLAGGIAHDFNNLLTAILGTTTLLMESLDPGSPASLDAAEIVKTARRAAGLTQQLLAFSRRQMLAPRVLDVNALVANLEVMLRRLIGADVALHTRLAPEPAVVRADPGQLEQAIVNLVVNARDAMPSGGTVTVETATVELDPSYVEMHAPAQPGSYVRLGVSDTGVGMDAATRAHLFEPFFTTKEPGRGTGLGLATVYGIVKQSGGYIWAYSEPGHGTTFKIYLPHVGAAPDTLAAGGAATPASALRGSETILVVEDEENVRRYTQRALEGLGYTVLTAANGPEALRLAAAHARPIHLLLADVVMPGMNGREVGRHLSARRPEMRVLYMSGYAADVVLQQGLLEPALVILQKPFTPDLLALKVREVLDASSMAGPPARQPTQTVSGTGRSLPLRDAPPE